MKVLMLHGTNLSMFGKRDPKQYGTVTLTQIVRGQIRGFNVDSYLLSLRASVSTAQLTIAN